MSYPWTAYKTWITGEILTAADLNNSVQRVVDSTTPDSMNDYSNNVAQMQSTADPYPASSESLASTTAGELERLRYVLAQITGKSQWYIDPDASIANLLTSSTTFAGSKIFSSAVTVTPVTNQLVLGTTNTTTISAAAPASSAVYTIQDVGTSANFVMSAGTQSIAGAKTLSSLLTASAGIVTTDIDAGASGTAGSLDVFPTTASKGKLTLVAADSAGNTTTTITNASQAGARTYTIQDAGASADFVMTAGNQTIAGNKTFSGTSTFSGTIGSLSIGASTSDGTTYRNLTLNSGTVGSRFVTQRTASVSSATTIIDTPQTNGMYIVSGSVNDAGTIRSFTDLILLTWSALPSITSAITTVSAANVNTPGARTYTYSGGLLKLAMASLTYSVTTFGVDFN